MSVKTFFICVLVLWVLIDIPTFVKHPDLCKRMSSPVIWAFPGAGITCWVMGK